MYFSKPSSARAICWGDKLRNRGATYGMRSRPILFRHLPSTEDAIFCFGKYRGENVKNVDDLNYMMWATAQLPLKPYQRMILEQKITLDLKKIFAKMTEKPINTHKNNKNTMKKLSFATAVLDTVCDFTAKKQNFSAYDVTRTLRQRVNDGELTILDGTPTIFRGMVTTEIPHYNRTNAKGELQIGVQEIVHDIFKQNDQTGYTPQDTGNYILYVYDDPVADLVGSLTATSAPLQQAVQNLTQAMGSPSGKASPLGDAVMRYILNRVTYGNVSPAPTLKQVQSAIKRTGNFTCEEIRNAALALGLRVQSNAHLSKSTVSR